MKMLLRNILILCALAFCTMSAFGQTEQEIEERYGKPLKSYKVSPSIHMVPQYAGDGQLWSATLYCSRISVNDNNFAGVHGAATLPWGELKTVLDEIIPKSERGELRQSYDDNTFGIISATYDYEHVSINFMSFYKEEEVSVGTYDIDPQTLEKKPVVVKKVPRSKAFMETTDEFKGEIARSSEFVQIIWLNRNRQKK